MNNKTKNYDNFYNGLTTGLLRELGSGYETRAITDTKNNGILKNGILIQDGSKSITPAIYLDEYYEDFCTGKCLNDIIRQILYTYRGGSDKDKKQSFYEIDFSPRNKGQDYSAGCKLCKEHCPAAGYPTYSDQ